MAIENLKIEARQKLVALYKQLGNISVTARRCGIARSTLQRWLKRQDEEELVDRSHRPKRLGCQKLGNQRETLVLKIRNEFNYGKLRICSHLLRLDNPEHVDPSK